MRIRLTVAAAGVGLAIAAVGAGGVLAGDSDQGPGQDPADVDARVVRAHPVAAGASAPLHARAAAGADRQAPPKRTKPELIYLETDPLVIPPGRSGQVVAACPGASKAINGYYFTKGVGTGFGLANEGDSPAGLRRWSFYLNNTTELDLGNVTFGMVCIKGVR
jgi:hypothetical protein